MNERLHLPPHHKPIDDNASLVFLAGPIQGSDDWQTQTALELIHHLDVDVASPRRDAASNDEFDYVEQVTWEHAHLERSFAKGVIAFWFSKQNHDLPYETGRSYAQTSRVEIGRALGWNDLKPFPLVVGFDPEYTSGGGGNERYIRAMCKAAGVEVYDSLHDVIDQTIFRLP